MAARNPGRAAEHGELDKAKRYDATVVAFSVEVGVRLGSQALAFLKWTAAEVARTTAMKRGWPATGLARRLATKIATLMTSWEAELVETAMVEPHWVAGRREVEAAGSSA